MEKSILIVGKDFPSGTAYLTAAMDMLRNVVMTKSPAVEETQQTPEQCVNWNRTSPISARNLVLKAEINSGLLDEALIIFDAMQYISKFNQIDIETFSRADDEMIRGYMYIVSEILSRFVKKGHGHLIFVAKPLADGQKGSIPLEMAYNGFIAMAESVASQFETLETPQITLVKATESDDEIAQWLFPYLDGLENLKEGKRKKGINWVRCGDKPGKKLFGR